MGRLAGKVAVVTGAARGTGAAIARHFVDEGATVVLADVLLEDGEAMATSLGANAEFQALDVAEPGDWQRVVAHVESRHGGIDILVNNAAVLLLAALDETSLEDFHRLVAVNQVGPFLGIQAVLAPMKRRGEGSIINIASTDGLKGMNGVTAYASTKWALRGITRSAAVELGHHRIRVNAICPEAGNPNMSAPFFPGNPDLSDVPHQMMQAILKAPDDVAPSSRLKDIANLAVFLASDESRSCTAADFVIDAGLTAGAVQAGVPRA